MFYPDIVKRHRLSCFNVSVSCVIQNDRFKVKVKVILSDLFSYFNKKNRKETHFNI